MSMVIRNNMEAVRTYNLLNSNHTNAQKHMQKVSTGMKLNSAQDDASAFAISERMRVRIRALDQAWQNTQNGSAMLKTAEGAVGNILETLRTLKEKAIDSANDSNTNEDRRTIQKEFNQLVDQIDDDALVTFNGMYLINNTRNNALVEAHAFLMASNFTVDTMEPNLRHKFTEFKSKSGESLNINDDDIILWSLYTNATGNFHGELKGSDTPYQITSYIRNYLDDALKYQFHTSEHFDASGTWQWANFPDKYGSTDREYENGIGIYSLLGGSTIYLNITVMNKEGTINQKATQLFKYNEMIRPELKTGDQALSFQVGAQANQATKVALTDMRAQALGLKGQNNYAGQFLSISTQRDANIAISVIDNAIKRVLDEQTNIAGALSRFEFTATNITTMTTNDQSSESVIRDADMATEMAGFVRYNVLSQSAQAMLAHANQEPNNVLALLNS